MSYLIPIGKIALSEQIRMRQQAVMAGKKLLISKSIASDPDQLVDRDPEYITDFFPNNAAAAAGLAGWLSMPLAVVGTPVSLLASNAPAAIVPQVPNNTAWVFYGAHVLTLNDPITELLFFTGISALRKAQFDVEKLYDALETEGYFTQPIVYGPQDYVTINIRPRVATGVGCRVVLDTLVIEPLQVSVS